MECLNVVDIVPGSLENERINEYEQLLCNLHCLMMMMMMVTLALQAGLQVIPEVLSYDKDISC